MNNGVANRTRSLHFTLCPGVLALALLVAGCPLRIGDRCEESIDCSSDGIRLCDVSQPAGYCLIPDCAGADFLCPNEAVCASFRDGAESFCLYGCADDPDCRADYVCCVPAPFSGNEVLPNPDGTAADSPGYCIAADADTGGRPAGCQ